jgi:hypothetical protein
MNNQEQTEKIEAEINKFLAVIGYIAWITSAIDDKLNDCVRVVLGTDIKRTMIVLPKSSLHTKLRILTELLKNQNFSAQHLKMVSRTFKKVEVLSAKRNDLIHSPWIGIFLQPDGTVNAVKHDITNRQLNQLRKIPMKDVVKLRTDLITCYSDVIISWKFIKDKFS